MLTLILAWYRFKYRTSWKDDDIKTIDIQAPNELNANEELYEKTKAVWWEAIPYTVDGLSIVYALITFI